MSNFKIFLAACVALISSSICVFTSFGETPIIFQVLNAVSLVLLCIAPVYAAKRDNLRIQRRLEAMGPEAELELYEGLSDRLLAGWMIVALALLGLVLVFPVRWPAALAFMITYVLTSLSIAKRTPLRDLFVAVAAALSIWPVSQPIIQRVETRIEMYLGRLVSDRLDSRSVLNFPRGRTLETVKGDLPVGLSDGSLPGLRFGLVSGAALGVFLRRGFFHIIGLSIIGWFWVVFLNAFYTYGQLLSLNGVRSIESFWGNKFILSLFGIILLLSSDQLLLIFSIFNPLTWISREKKKPVKKAILEEAEAELDQPSTPKTPLPNILFHSIGGLMLLISILDIGKQYQNKLSSQKIQDIWKTQSVKQDPTLFPDKLGNWARTNAALISKPPVEKEKKSQYLLHSNYISDDKLARLTFSGPYMDWFDRILQYQADGWTISNTRVISGPNVPNPMVLFGLRYPTGENCTLAYSMNSITDGTNIPPSFRSFFETIWWNFLQSLFLRGHSTPDFYMTEVFHETYGALNQSDSLQLDDLIKSSFGLKLPTVLKPVR